MKHSLLIVCIIIFSLMICGCTSFNSTSKISSNTSSNTSQDTIPSDMYVGVLEEYTNQSTLIGTPPYTPFPPMPIPTPMPVLDFDNSQGYTEVYLWNTNSPINDSFKGFILKEYLVSTPTQYGYAGEIYAKAVYDLPYTVEGGFIIENITSNGTILARYKNQSIVLGPGENTTIIMSSVNKTGVYLANKVNSSPYDYFNATLMPWPVTNEQVYTFTNEGIYNKSLINSSYSNK